MKRVSKSIFSFVVAASLFACAGAEKKAEENSEEMTEETTEEVVEVKEVSIKAGESKVGWEGSVLGVYSHSGTVDIREGVLEFEGDKVTGGELVVDLTSMQATDENYNPEEGKTKEKLVGHLSSPDFFMVDSFPSANFKIIEHNVEEGTIKGSLTIRDNTKEETVSDVVINGDEGTATGTMVINRQDYDVAFKHPAEDVVVSDDITLNINIKM